MFTKTPTVSSVRLRNISRAIEKLLSSSSPIGACLGRNGVANGNGEQNTLSRRFFHVVIVNTGSFVFFYIGAVYIYAMSILV
jgi:hypothetical protein